MSRQIGDGVSVSIVGGKFALLERARQKGGKSAGRFKEGDGMGSAFPRQPGLNLNDQQRAEATRIYERLKDAFDRELLEMAELMASKSTGQLFGQTEFELRDRVHALGAQVLETAADERQKKGGIRGS
jgi:hypothetical protein